MSRLPGTPNLTQVLEEAIAAAGHDIRVSLPGVVTGVSSDRKRASVRPAVGNDPVIPDVPLLFPKGISWPVEVGDGCLLVFGDRSLEEWQSAGGRKAVSPSANRAHDLTDAVAIPVGMGGVKSGREDDVSIAIEGGCEVRLQDDAKMALGHESRSGLYKDYKDDTDTPWGEAVELIEVLVELLAGLLTKPLIQAPGEDLPFSFKTDVGNVVAKAKSKLEAIKGSL